MTIAAYPLVWPANMPRSPKREKGTFKTSLAGALDNVRHELARFANDSGRPMTELILSSNVSLGVPRPIDPGVAAWFKWDGLQLCIPLDRYLTVEANLQAIFHIVNARRTELRHGTLTLVRASFSGFLALPPAGDRQRSWREVLNFVGEPNPTRAQIDDHYRTLAKRAHPDLHGGSHERMTELNRARDEALKEVQ